MTARRTFNNSRGFQAQADVSINSPAQTNNQSVNVIVSPLTKDRAFRIVTNSQDEPKPVKSNEPAIVCQERDIKLDDGLSSDMTAFTLSRVSPGRAAIE